jgi:hypothetical protein
MEEHLDPEKIDRGVDLQLEMDGVILATFTAAVVQYDRWHEFSDDVDVQKRGGEQLDEIVEMKNALGPAYAKTCRDIWNAHVDMTLDKIEREEHYWYEGAGQPGRMAGYIAEKRREESGQEGVREVALTREQINREMQEYARIREEMRDQVGKGVVNACDDIYRSVIEEGGYGRTIHDLSHERQLPEADKGQEAVDDEQKQIEDIRQSFYRTQEQEQAQGQEPDQGIGV